jgi:leucyl aminopeptidase
MDIQITTQAVQDVECDALIVVVARHALGKGTQDVLLSSPAMHLDNALDGVLSNVCAEGEFKGDFGELLTLHTMGRITPNRVIVVGLGMREKIRTHTLRLASQIAAQHAHNIGLHQVALAVAWDNEYINTVQAVQAQVEGAMLGAYTFRRYQHSERNGRGIAQFLLVADKADELEQAM